MTDTAPILAFDRVRISYFVRAGEANVIPALSFQLGAGEAFGLVGESGCGKSTVALAAMRYLGRAGRVTAGQIQFEGRNLAALDEAELKRLRGRRIAMVYQDPMSSLNPVMTVGRQLMEVPRIHEGIGWDAARERALAMLREVSLPDPAAMLERYPHQLSGGQQQRIVIAMALIAEPALLVMDEPTTGLDVTVEAAVLDLVAALRRTHRTAILFISHNLGTVARVCDRIGVMYAGELVEEGPVDTVFRRPAHPYTRGLLASVPTLGADKRRGRLSSIPGQVGSPLARPAGCSFAPRCAHADPGRCTVGTLAPAPVAGSADHSILCVRAGELPPWQRPNGGALEAAGRGEAEPMVEIAGLRMHYARRPVVRAVEDVSLTIERGRTLAIVGESGSGKSTLAKVLAGLETATEGSVRLLGEEIGDRPVEQRPTALKRRIQMVFQNPDSTLNPSHSVGFAIGRALRRLQRLGRSEAARRTERLLEAVQLPASFARRRPHQLSGGQKQRVAIARALAGDPDLMVADEPVSALDVSVQSAIINLLIDLQAERGQTLVFISHDLGVVRHLADHVAVMYLGRVVEHGPVDAVFQPPFHPYTEALLSAVPRLDAAAQGPRILLEGAMPSATTVIQGCPFASRCPRKLGPVCDNTPPPDRSASAGHRIACHIPLDDLGRSAA